MITSDSFDDKNLYEILGVSEDVGLYYCMFSIEA